MPTFDSDIAALKYLRKSNNWTQVHLGKKIGVSHPQISRYEKGVDKVNSAKNKKIEKLLEEHDIKIIPDQASPTDDLLIMGVYRSFNKAERKMVANYIYELKRKTVGDEHKKCLEQLN